MTLHVHIPCAGLAHVIIDSYDLILAACLYYFVVDVVLFGSTRNQEAHVFTSKTRHL